MTNIRKYRAVLSLAIGFPLVLGGLSACGANDLGGGGGTTADTSGDVDCSAYEQYGKHEGTTVSVFSSIRQIEADQIEETFKDFTKCTGITVEHNGVGEFESQIVVQVEGGNAPDLAIFPQPGLLKRMVLADHVIEAPAGVKENVEKGWNPEWQEYGTIDGKLYASPLMAAIKSFVWYSPKAFKEKGYEIPATWEELMSLTNKIADDTKDSQGVKPWCAGIESGGATGWTATDWVEDLVLRTAGPETYDKWVNHTIPFNDPAILEATNKVGDILLNDDYVNGGLGDSRSIATTSFNDAGLPLLEDQCFLHRQASFYEAQFPEGTDISPEGDIFAFYLPGPTADNKPLLVGGEFVGAFNNKPETEMLQQFMSSAEWANLRVEVGGVTSANKAVDPAKASSPVLKLAIELLQDQNAVARFDGSDQMPSEVGAGSFWTGMTQWINGQKDAQTVLTEIEASWPQD